MVGANKESFLPFPFFTVKAEERDAWGWSIKYVLTSGLMDRQGTFFRRVLALCIRA
jgi:hypothetical protein